MRRCNQPGRKRLRRERALGRQMRAQIRLLARAKRGELVEMQMAKIHAECNRLRERLQVAA